MIYNRFEKVIGPVEALRDTFQVQGDINAVCRQPPGAWPMFTQR
ncbi:MAG: hypothetical protein AAGE43_13675 [Pseudomonadota bacterium]